MNHRFHKQGTMTKGYLKGYPMYDLDSVSEPEWEEVYKDMHTLQAKHPQGYLVRNMAGFTSYRRIKQWAKALGTIPALHLYSVTSRVSHIGLGRVLHWLNVEYSDKCTVRFLQDRYAQYQINIEPKGEETGVVCPISTGKKQDCLNCGLCWSTEEPISLSGSTK
jgi:hypothetical protein